MDYIFNNEKIESLLMDFYVSTGINITVYDASMAIIASAHADPPYCRHVQNQLGLSEKCTFSDTEHLKIVERTKKTLFYTCHAGIMEMITPIFYEDTLIAYLQIGQFRDDEQIYSSEKILVEKGLFDGEILALYETLSRISQRKLQALTNLTDLIIKSFWADGLVYANRSMLSVKIERYIEARLREKISVDELCAEFFLSKNALYRLFSTEFKTTVHEYVLEKRIRLAKSLLRNDPTRPLAQISDDCGFSDYNYFIRAFRKTTGTTPHQFRLATNV